MGQEVSVTPIQIVSAISAIANGGTLNRSHIVHEINGVQPGTLPEQPAPQQATDARTAATMREMMESVVLEGTGKPARLDGYTAGGKSGTAQMIDLNTKRYSATKYNASFVGFAPVNNPAVTILVVLDSPEGQHHGGLVGGPVFKRVAEQVLTYMDVPHDVPVPSNTETAKNMHSTQRPSATATAVDDSSKERYAAAVANKKTSTLASPQTIAFGDPAAVMVPNLAGQSVRAVSETCSRLGLVPGLIGSGVAVEQSPESGAVVLRGSRVTVRFGRPGELVPAAARRSGN